MVGGSVTPQTTRHTPGKENNPTQQKEGNTMTDFWDDAELRTGGDFVKFDQPGDTVTGEITGIRKHQFEDGKVVPQIFLNIDGEERTLTAGQVRLKALLGEKRPNVGDTITVTLTDVEKRAGGKTLKIFTLDVNTTTAPAAPAAPAATNEAPDLSALTDTQRAALNKLGL
jgi:hypothetical protein